MSSTPESTERQLVSIWDRDTINNANFTSRTKDSFVDHYSSLFSSFTMSNTNTEPTKKCTATDSITHSAIITTSVNTKPRKMIRRKVELISCVLQ